MKCNCLITWQITPERRYVKPCNKAIAFHISMTAPKYAMNLIIALTLHFQNQFFENNTREKETNERVNKGCFPWQIFGGARLNTQSIFSPTTCIELGGSSIFA